MTTAVLAPLAVFPMGLQLLLMQPAACRQCCSTFLLYSVTEALNSVSLVEEYFDSCILRSWYLQVRWMPCRLPVLQALPFPCSVWSGLYIHLCIHTGGMLCHHLYLTDHYLVRLIAGICGERRATTEKCLQGGDLRCFHDSYQNVRGRGMEDQPRTWQLAFSRNVFLKALGRNKKTVL